MATINASVLNDLAPSGRLRAAINFGNYVLAQKNPHTGEPQGLSVDMATELGRRLGVPTELVAFEGSSKVFEAVKENVWDISFLAIDPVRIGDLSFTAPYIITEGTYLVQADSRFQTIEDVDATGVRIAASRNAACDLYLSRTLKYAQIVRSQSAKGAMETFLSERLEAVAGVKQPLQAFASAHPEVRMIPGRFMAIEQALGIAKERIAGARYLCDFIEEMKSSDFVVNGLQRSGQRDVTVVR